MQPKEEKVKICITSQGNDLDAQVDPRFGRCRYFIIVDSETMQFKAIENKGVNESGGAGISSAQLLINEGVDVLITGDVGPNASQALSSSQIKIITGASGTVREALKRFLGV